MLKSLLEQIVREGTEGAADVALLLSGGVDSLSIGFAAQAIGKRVHAWTFRLNGEDSEDSVAARKSAKAIGWSFNLVDVKTNQLEDSFIELANKWKCRKKTQFECTFPFLQLTPAIQQSIVMSGIAADGHFGLSKKAMIHWRYPKEKFDQFRTSYFNSENPAGQLQQKAVIESCGKKQVAPYLDRRMFDYFIKYNWDEINKPRQKEMTLAAYPNEFALVPVRKHANLQLVAGVDKAFERLLTSPINKKNRTRVMDLCRDYSSDRNQESFL